MQLDGQLAGDPEAVELFKSVVAIKVDLTSRDASNPARDVAVKYGVHGIPDFRIIGKDGKELEAMVGPSVKDVKSGIRKALGK